MLVLHCEDKGVRHLAINKIAGGALDRNKILNIVSNVFMGMNIKIYMYK